MTSISKSVSTFDIEVMNYDIEGIFNLEDFNIECELQYRLGSFELLYRGCKDPFDF